MLGQTGPADPNGVLVLTGTPVLLGKLRKSNRRRIPLDPASKFFNPRVVRHGAYGTTSGLVVVAVRPRLSVTVNRLL